MPKKIGTARAVTVHETRETFRIEVEVGGTAAAPVYELRGHAHNVIRDADGAEIARKQGLTTTLIADAKLKSKVRAAIELLLATVDDEAEAQEAASAKEAKDAKEAREAKEAAKAAKETKE